MSKLSSGLKPGLAPRHVNMIAIGGTIGTGIFLASGYSIFLGGPGGAVVAYLAMAVLIYLLMDSLSELSTYLPSNGSFCDYSYLYVGASWGFAMGYNYWLNWAITVAAQLAAAALVMSYWFPHVNPVWFSLIFFITTFLANIISVRKFGEIEYWLSWFKVSVIIAFIVLAGFSCIAHPQLSISHWNAKGAPFHSGWNGILIVFLYAGFAFQGFETVGITSGELAHSKLRISKAISTVFWRLTLFYVLSIVVMTFLLDYNDPHIATLNSVTMSPYTFIFGKYLGSYAASFINFIILVALLSSANAGLYSGSRILWYLGEIKQAPKIVTYTTKSGVPVVALIITSLIGALALLSYSIDNGVLFSYLVQISSLCGFLAWFSIALSHYEFRRSFLPELGGDAILKYKARFYPWGQILAMLVLLFIITVQFITLDSSNSSILDIVMVYSSVILFCLLYLVHKLYSTYLLWRTDPDKFWGIDDDFE